MNIHYCFGFVCYTGIPHMLTAYSPPTSIFLSHHSMRKKGVEEKEKEKGREEKKEGEEKAWEVNRQWMEENEERVKEEQNKS